MTDQTEFRLRDLASARSTRLAYRSGRGITALLLRLGCVAALAWIGYIHLHLWQQGYRQIPTDGPMFLLDAIAAFVLAATLLALPRPLTGLLAAGFTAATLGALLVSLGIGLFGFRESISASYVVESLVLEAAAAIALLGWTVLVAVSSPRPRRPAAATLELPLTR